MTDAQHTRPATASDSRLIRIAIWVAIGALIAAAIVCVIWVLVGEQNGLVGRAFLTILLLAAFAGVALLDAHLAARRPAWFALTSMIVWVVTLLLGAFLIWMPQRDFFYGVGVGRFMSFLLIILILQLAVLHVRLFIKAHQRFVTTFTKIVTFTTLGLVALLAFLLVFPLTFGEYIDFRDAYWRVVVAIAILAAVGTALVPLVNALFAPKRPRAAVPIAPPVPPAQQYPGAALPPWPTYGDGATPLPMLPDGTPDWNAYYTGYPSPGAQVFAPAPVAAPAPQPPAPDAAQQTWHSPSAPQGQLQQPWWVQSAQPSSPDPAEPQPGRPEMPAAQPVAPEAEPEGDTPPSGFDGFPPPPPLPPRS